MHMDCSFDSLTPVVDTSVAKRLHPPNAKNLIALCGTFPEKLLAALHDPHPHPSDE